MSVINNLVKETSPYLLQHANNPVNWYPWGEAAFEKAKKEGKPIFLSIGYSTCHWCHVMAHECFEDKTIAEVLNKYFISIKVDKEERPDIDSIYMSVCQAFTGSGGWPTSIFMTPEQKPFFAGTYFPKNTRNGMIGFYELLLAISNKWENSKNDLIKSGDEITASLKSEHTKKPNITNKLLESAVESYKRSFDVEYGGFGGAPKFPTPHNLMFLMDYYKITKDNEALKMVEKTLLQMYKGGIFDHIGYGFSRYSTDKYYLVPHFEKMLYDNALLMISYAMVFDITKNELYKSVAIKIYQYVTRELQDPKGGLYSAQDADSEGVEGKYYVFEYDEIIKLLGNELGEKFNRFYNITKNGNFEGKNIPNLLSSSESNNEFETILPLIYKYRKNRTKLHLDDKILTSWNSLMIVGFVLMYRVIGEDKYLQSAIDVYNFINKHLCIDDVLFVSCRDGKTSDIKGFLDDYAFYIYALVNLYEATFEEIYLEKATKVTSKVINEFFDSKNGGFYLYGNDNEQLIMKPKETYDGAIPSGNSCMAYNLMMMAQLNNDEELNKLTQSQMEFMSSYANEYPTGYGFYLISLLKYLNPSKKVVCVLKDKSEKEALRRKFPLNYIVRILDEESKEYPLINNKTTYYLCQNYSCLPPSNDLDKVVS